jgi:hypothetical protein
MLRRLPSIVQRLSFLPIQLTPSKRMSSSETPGSIEVRSVPPPLMLGSRLATCRAGEADVELLYPLGSAQAILHPDLALLPSSWRTGSVLLILPSSTLVCLVSKPELTFPHRACDPSFYFLPDDHPLTGPADETEIIPNYTVPASSLPPSTPITVSSQQPPQPPSSSSHHHGVLPDASHPLPTWTGVETVAGWVANRRKILEVSASFYSPFSSMSMLKLSFLYIYFHRMLPVGSTCPRRSNGPSRGGTAIVLGEPCL